MGVIKKGLLLISLFVQNSFAQGLEVSKTKAKLLLNAYKQNGEDGKQVYDNSGNEDATVFEPMLFIEHQISEETSINGNFVFDTWSAESDTRLDGNTGASGSGIEQQSRVSAKLGAKREKNSKVYSAFMGYSSEYDYRSMNAGLSAEFPFAKDNFILGFGAQAFLDQTKLFDVSNQTATEFKHKNIFSFDLNASQLLSPKDVISFGATYIMSSGALEGIANTVKVNGSRTNELLPKSRDRYALFTKYIHAFNDVMSVGLKYRYYDDDWDLSSHLIKPTLNFSLFDDLGFLQFSYRYYMQDQVKYYQNDFSTTLENMTSDSDLRKFKSQEYGVFYSYNLNDVKFIRDLEDFTLSFNYLYYKRSNELSYHSISFGLGATM